VVVTRHDKPFAKAKVFVDGQKVCDFAPCQVTTRSGPTIIQARAGHLQGGKTVAVGPGGPEYVTIALAGMDLEAPELVPKPEPKTPPTATSPASTDARVGGGSATPPNDDTDEPEDPAGEHGLVHFNSMPPAEVFVDGRRMGRTPLTGVKLAPGMHAVVFRAPGLAAATRSVKVEAGKTRVVAIRLGDRKP